LRRRGYTPESIRNFCERIGVAKKDSIIDIALLEHCIREDLNKRAPRVMAVLRPLKVVIDNYPGDKVEELDAINNPEDPAMGIRKVPFSRELYIEREDFLEDPPKKFFRLAPGREVRLRYAYFIKCVGVVKDPHTGEVIELHCTYDPATRGGDAPDGRKVGATLHWVSAAHSIHAEVRLYDHLFINETPGDEKEGGDFKSYLNPNSLQRLRECRVEPGLAGAAPGNRYQFERMGYFCLDSADSSEEELVFNRTVSLRDIWAKIKESENKNGGLKDSDKKTKASLNEIIPPLTVRREDISPISEEITIEDFSKIDLRVAVIREASQVEGTKKMIRLMVDLGEGRLRQIFAGIRSAYPEPEELVGKKVIVVANLKPRQMKFGLSEGMVLAGVGTEHLCLPTFDGPVLPGDTVS
jgi:methionine--tRNA ligase beta chain